MSLNQIIRPTKQLLHRLRKHTSLREAVDALYAHGRAATDVYTHLLLECVRSKDLEQAKRLQTHMNLNSFQSNSFLQNRLLYLYGTCSKITTARQLFDKMPQRDVFSWNTMISAYSKSGSLDNARSLFEQMPVRDSVSWNSMIGGFVDHGYAEEALECFLQMRRAGFEPNEYTHVSVLTACSQLSDLKRGKQIHGRLAGGGIGVSNFNVFVWNCLLDMYAKCGDIEYARQVFDRMPDRNLVSWNSMISGYLRNGHPEKSLCLFQRMQVAGFGPNLVTLSSVLGAYLKAGKIDEARRMFEGMSERDKVCWTAMIIGYAQNGKEEEGLILFQEMLSACVKPDNVTISTVIGACAGLALLDPGKVIHALALLIGIESDLLVSSSLVNMYSKCGEITDAWIVFQGMTIRNTVSWNAMIVGYAQNGRDREAIQLYEKMLQENMKPDNITLVGVLSACSHACLIENGRRYFHSMSKSHGLTPAQDHFACMIYLLGRSGNLDEAVDLIKNMPSKPSCLIWSTLLSVCRINGNIEVGEMAAKKLFELDPLNAGPYIMLSNMYASVGRWDDVAGTRLLMKERNIKKSAAYSWIEVNNRVHKFIADDRTHPQTEEIYKEVMRLVLKLGRVGFIPDTNSVLHDVGEKEKIESICYHSEKLALAFGLISRPQGTAIRIVKNIRVCGDCHLFMKLVSDIEDRHIILRDSSRFHHFADGQCSCKDYW